jgi:outer membrane protein
VFSIVLTLSAAAQTADPNAIVPVAIRSGAQADYCTSAAPISLHGAIVAAMEKNPLRKAAWADQRAAAADVREAKSALLPRLTLSESATRSNDPVFAFGTRLRQGRFTAQDFALNALNSPTPIGNFASRFSGQWSLFHAPDWLNVERAKKMQEVAAQQFTRTDQQTVLRVVNAYYGLLLATRQQQVAEQQVETSRSVLRFSRARYDTGMVVEADYLAAQVNEAARQQEVIRTGNAASLARAELNTAMGVPLDVIYEPAEILEERGLELLSLGQAEKQALDRRPELKELVLQQDSAEIGTRMAQSDFLPRVSAFAGWEQDNRRLLGGGGNNWTAGIDVSIDLFTGGQKTAQLQRARAMQDKLAALRQAAIDNIRLEVRKTWYDADSSRRQLEVARVAIKQSEENLRIVQTRYQSGLNTITDLLRVEDSTRRTRADYWQAVYGTQTSLANLEFAMGTLSEYSAVVP